MGGDDVYEGSGGEDAVAFWVPFGNFNNAATQVIADIGAGTASGQGIGSLSGIEDLVGTPWSDTLTGTRDQSTVREGSNDMLSGLDGDDLLNGGPKQISATEVRRCPETSAYPSRHRRIASP